MADEPRRSGRATKGQHTKDREGAEDGQEKRKGKGKGSKSKQVEEEQEDEEIIRCICGEYEEEEDEPRAMICCDKCSAWQHNSCMGLPEDYAPEQYFCEQCKPADHKDLLVAISRGEKPWEDAIRRRELMLAEKKAKKGKKGRKSGGSHLTEAAPEESSSPAPSGGQKRKAADSPVAADIKGVKKARSTPVQDTNGSRAGSQARKTSQTPSRTASVSIPNFGPVVEDVKELTNPVRSGAAKSLVKLFIDQTKDAVKAKAFTVPQGSNAQEVGTRLGLNVEHALYHVQSAASPEPSDAYKTQLRSIVFNVKKNPTLAHRLLNQELHAHTLASMDPKDMASEEQQRKDAATIKELERQHTIVEEQGPRIRRTHKGDEFVHEADQVAAEASSSKVHVRKPSKIETDLEIKSPSVKSPTEEKPKTTTPFITRRDPKRQGSSNFDINKVWSNVQGSPDGEQRFGEVQPQSGDGQVREPAGPGAKPDADIDILLQDEEADADSPPYSPKDEEVDPGVVWRGIIKGNNLCHFNANAKFACGAMPDAPTLRLTYNDIVPSEIVIGGRIKPSSAEEYLCGLEFSQTTDVVVIYIPEPHNPSDCDQFDRLFKYLKERERFGVGNQHVNPAIKDIYLLPMEAGQELPDFIKKLETDFEIKERMLIVPIVIKNSELPHNEHLYNAQNAAAGTVQSPAQSQGHGQVAQTPITPHEPQFGFNYEAPQAPVQNGTSQTQSKSPPAYTSTPPPYTAVANTAAADSAIAAAQRILGPHANAPAVAQLIASAPNARDAEMEVVKGCILENPQAAESLEVLTRMLQDRWGSQS